MDERINPIRITDKKTGEVYELDFNRESLYFADQQEFKVNEVTVYPNTNIPRLFYYAFRKNHRKMTKAQTDSLLDRLGGLTPKMIERLILLYEQAATANRVQDEEDLEKNADMAVEM